MIKSRNLYIYIFVLCSRTDKTMDQVVIYCMLLVKRLFTKKILYLPWIAGEKIMYHQKRFNVHTYEGTFRIIIPIVD